MENEAWLSALMTSTQHCTEDLEQYHMLKNEINEIKIGKEELKKNYLQAVWFSKY